MACTAGAKALKPENAQGRLISSRRNFLFQLEHGTQLVLGKRWIVCADSTGIRPPIP